MLEPKLFSTALNDALEKLLNTQLRYDRFGAPCLSELAGKTFLIQLEDLNLSFYLLVQTERIYFSQTLEGAPDATLRTHSLLWPLLKAPNSREPLLTQHKAQLEGDTALAHQLLDCLYSLKPDLGAFMEHWLGTLPASLFTQTEHRLQKLFHHLKETGTLTLKEYLQFEAGVLPSREEFMVFTDLVAETAKQAEKLQTLLDQLETSIHEQKN